MPIVLMLMIRPHRRVFMPGKTACAHKKGGFDRRIKLILPVRPSGVLKQFLRNTAGIIVHQDINLPKSIFDLTNHISNLSFICNVGLDKQGLPAGRLDCFKHPLRIAFFFDLVQDNP